MAKIAYGQNATEAHTNQMTLGHLFMAIVFFLPAGVVIGQVRHAGGGVIRYLIGVSLALVFGAAIVRISWLLGRAMWMRTENRSEGFRSALVATILGLEVVSVGMAFWTGEHLSTLVIRFL